MKSYKEIVGVEEELIDKDIRELVKLFNIYGFKTTQSCQGHTSRDILFIIFDDSVKEKDIDLLSELLFNTSNYVGEFIHWVRRSYDESGNAYIAKNWEFTISLYDYHAKKEAIDSVCDMMRKIISIQRSEYNLGDRIRCKKATRLAYSGTEGIVVGTEIVGLYLIQWDSPLNGVSYRELVGKYNIELAWKV